MKISGEGNSSSIAELCAGTSGRAWFCLRTHLKHEHIAAAHLRSIAGVEAFNPQLRVLRSTRRGRRWSTECLFPNYVFARFVLASLLEKVSYTPGVKFVLRFGDRVPEVPDQVIENLREELAETASEVITDSPSEGDQIEIVDGAFAGTKALVTQVMPGEQRARVLIDVMGRSVPAELNLGLVLFNRKHAAEIALKRAAQTAVKQAPVVPGPLAKVASNGTCGRVTGMC